MCTSPTDHVTTRVKQDLRPDLNPVKQFKTLVSADMDFVSGTDRINEDNAKAAGVQKSKINSVNAATAAAARQRNRTLLTSDTPVTKSLLTP